MKRSPVHEFTFRDANRQTASLTKVSFSFARGSRPTAVQEQYRLKACLDNVGIEIKNPEFFFTTRQFLGNKTPS